MQQVELSDDLVSGLAGVSERSGEDDAPAVKAEESAETRPRAQARRPAGPSRTADLPPPPIVIDPLKFPASNSYWAAKKRNSLGEWEVMMYAPEGSQIAAREWPIADLSEGNLIARWGAGDYTITGVKPTPNGGRQYVGPGRLVRVTAPRVAPAAPPSEVAASVFASGPATDVFNMMSMLEKMVDAKQARVSEAATAQTNQLMAIAQMMTGGAQAQARGGLGAAELELILRNNQETMLAAVARQLEPLKAEMATLRAREPEAGGPGLGDAARAAGSFIKGKGNIATILNWASENDELAKEIVKHGLPIVATAVTKVSDVVGEVLRPRTPAAPVESRPVASPRAPVVEAAPVAVEPARLNGGTVTEGGSLSSWPSSDRVAVPAPVVPPEAS